MKISARLAGKQNFKIFSSRPELYWEFETWKFKTGKFETGKFETVNFETRKLET